MKNFKSAKTQAKTLIIDDHFKMGGQMYRISQIRLSSYTSGRLHITAHLLGGDDRFEDITLFVTPFTKFKIYNQSYPKQ